MYTLTYYNIKCGIASIFLVFQFKIKKKDQNNKMTHDTHNICILTELA